MTSESDSESSSVSDSESNSVSNSELRPVHESESDFIFARRFALIFGNNAYAHRPLKSCHKDGRDMAKILTILGFICIVVLDTNKRHMEIIIEETCKKIKKDDCLLVYFSGHGKEEKGENYLISVELDSNAADNAISLNFVIEKLNKCGNKLNIIILDACRGDKNNKTFQNKATNSSDHSTSEVISTSITDSTQVRPYLALIFSCDPGCYSYDGVNSECNSTFTGVLLDHLPEKDLTLEQIIRRVMHDVSKKSRDEQRPWINTCLPKTFHFNNGSDAFVRTPQWNFDRLKKATVKVNIGPGLDAMTANNKYLLYCPKGYLCLVDSNGTEKLRSLRDFYVHDMCWSSYRTRFLILDTNNCLYSLNHKTQQYKQILTFSKETYGLTCYGKRLMIITDETIDEYEMEQWELVKKFSSTKLIHKIQFDSSGIYLGIIRCENGSTKDHRFQLCHSLDMKVLRDISFGSSSADLLSLPNGQFLISLTEQNKLCVFDPNDLSKEEIQYGKTIRSIALLGNGKRLIIQTTNPEKLRFHGLIKKSTET